MHNSLAMNVLNTFKNLPHDVTSFFLRQSNYRGQVIKKFSIFAQLKNQEYEGAGLKNVMKFDWNFLSLNIIKDLKLQQSTTH